MRLSRIEIFLLLIVIFIAGFLATKGLTAYLRKTAKPAAGSGEVQVTQSSMPVPAEVAYPAVDKTATKPGCPQGTISPDYIYFENVPRAAFQKGEKTVTVPIDAMKLCYLKGTIVDFVNEAKNERGLFINRGRGRVADISLAGILTLEVLEAHLGTGGGLAQHCMGFCDRVVDEMIPEYQGQPVTIVDARPVAEQEATPYPGAKSAPIELGAKPEEGAFQKIGEITNKTFLVFTASPTFSHRGVTAFMAGLKKRGAKTVLWLAGGITGLKKIPMSPPSIPDVREVRPLDTPVLLKKGAKFCYVDSIEKITPMKPIAGSMIVKTKINRYLPVTIEPSLFEILTADDQFDFSNAGMRSEDEIIIYGDNWFDWRAHHLLINMKRKGYKNLVWLRDGLSGYREAEDLKLLP